MIFVFLWLADKETCCQPLLHSENLCVARSLSDWRHCIGKQPADGKNSGLTLSAHLFSYVLLEQDEEKK